MVAAQQSLALPRLSASHVIERAGVRLSVEEAGEGTPIVLLHGLTATRRYVVMGSRALERGGHRVIAYDARGHGRSWPAPEGGVYSYPELALDLEAVLDALAIPRAVLAGASMGAHTALRLALRAPDRAAALVLVTPAYDPATNEEPARLARWDALSYGLRSGGTEGFLQAYEERPVPSAWRATVSKGIRQRLSLHEHPGAVADALRGVPRSQPFGELRELAAISVPVTIVASADAADPEHPLAVGEAYAAAIPGARLLTDEPGRSPLAWQGNQLSKVIAEVAASAEL
ncbi:MAG: alpha/beta fold hydrolase [Solirubrobacteraceae bacterium]